MPHNAITNTAAATDFNPSINPVSNASPNVSTPKPKATINTADGNVNPANAAIPPGMPARLIPIAKPNWLLLGPGRKWHNATKPANERSSNHCSRVTYSCLKYPMCATGPPKEVRPSRKATKKTSLIRFIRGTVPEYPTWGRVLTRADSAHERILLEYRGHAPKSSHASGPRCRGSTPRLDR